jgi:hypothetical protein
MSWHLSPPNTINKIIHERGLENKNRQKMSKRKVTNLEIIKREAKKHSNRVPVTLVPIRFINGMNT